MEKKFITLLADPINRKDLELAVFQAKEENIIAGVLIEASSKNIYPIIDGVPVMIPDSIPNNFKAKYREQFDQIQSDSSSSNLSAISNWSFSSEWEYFFESDMDETWGWSVQDRYEQFLMETETSEEELKNKTVLDAGCGNGQLTQLISNNAGLTVGIDLSDSVFGAERHRKSKNVCYIRGDLQRVPFKEGAFDIVVSNGVIHHTRSTRVTFNSLSRAVADNGKYYIWLYSRKGNFPWKVKRLFFDFARVIICRMPKGIQKFFVKLFVAVLGMFHDEKKEFLEIAMYDSITPRWRHYHTPEEVAHWYYQEGYGPITLSHFDNSYGFGVVGTKAHPKVTPGEHYGLRAK